MNAGFFNIRIHVRRLSLDSIAHLFKPAAEPLFNWYRVRNIVAIKAKPGSVCGRINGLITHPLLPPGHRPGAGISHRDYPPDDHIHRSLADIRRWSHRAAHRAARRVARRGRSPGSLAGTLVGPFVGPLADSLVDTLQSLVPGKAVLALCCATSQRHHPPRVSSLSHHSASICAIEQIPITTSLSLNLATRLGDATRSISNKYL